MSNIFAPFGFRQYRGTGSMSTYETVRMRIASGNATAIYTGDAVVPVTGTSTGYIKRATASTVAFSGIFVGCKYLSKSMARTVWMPYWPGSDANGDVEAYVVSDPLAQFVVQTGNSNTTAAASGLANIGKLCNIGTAVDNAAQTGGGGNTANGQSQMYLDLYTIATTATLPFQIVDVYTDVVPGSVGGNTGVGSTTNPLATNGTDTTSAYNYVIVGFNNAMTQGGGARTGIS